MLLGATFLVTLLGFCAALGTVLVTYEEDNLMVDIVGAPENSTMLLVRLRSHAASCMDTDAAAVKEELLIQDANLTAVYHRNSLEPGRYCAMVVSPSGNITSQQPIEVKEEHHGTGAKVGRSMPIKIWNATIDIKGSYQEETIQATVTPYENNVPQCKQLLVALWMPWGTVLDPSISCNKNYSHKEDRIVNIANRSMVVKFDTLTKGNNYCVRVTPIVCDTSVEYITIYSKVIQLPPDEPGPREADRHSQLWLLLLPFLVGAAVVIALTVLCLRRQHRLAREEPFILEAHLHRFDEPRVDPGPPVVKVVYSRDSESHVTAVSRLCELLRRELGFRVEWDEAAMHLAHVTHDWAMAMAQLPCPHFNPTAMAATPVKILVIESDGALLKHQAYRQHKDLGQVSESNVDELYHTTYAALLSKQAQALGDYCHITVARLPYTTLPDRLDLVPEKRYMLPEHLQPLLQTLLHGTTLPQSGAELALLSEAHHDFSVALADAEKSHNEKGFAEDSICGKLRAILAHT
ncbi:hypothetical protein MTO96_026382 [Rhipicephalus appendiculatus]